MGTVVALDQFRRELDTHEAASFNPPKKPALRGSEIWGTDYTTVEGVVFGLLKVREIMAYYFGMYDMEFDHVLLNALDKAYNLENCGHGQLVGAIRPAKDIMAEVINEDNRRDISLGLVILDLIEKSPNKKKP